MEFFGYSIPWWFWGAPALAVGAALFLAAWRYLGMRTAIIATLTYSYLASLALAHRKGAQRGWEVRKKMESRDDEKLAQKVTKIRKGYRDGLDDADAHDRLYDDDGFRRD